MKKNAQNDVTGANAGVERRSVKSDNGKFVRIKVGPISKEHRKIIRDIIKWEDESAKSDFVISPGRSHHSKDE